MVISTLFFFVLIAGIPAEFHNAPVTPKNRVYFDPADVHVTSTGGPQPPPSMPPMPTSPESEGDIVSRIKDFGDKLRVGLMKYLGDDVKLPCWEPTEGSDEFRAHVAALNIPALSPLAPNPSLLLHDLGERSRDERLAERVRQLFNIGSRLK